MREILFRGKRTDNGEWAYGDVLQGKYHGVYIVELADDASGVLERVNWIEVDPSTVGQYTGLTDKNEKKIFEGDMLQILEVGNNFERQFITDVIWEDGAFMVSGYDVDYYDTYLSAYYEHPDEVCSYPLHEIKVIGNALDNPELLESTP